MNKYLPSKKFIYIVVSIIVVLAIFYLLILLNEKNNKTVVISPEVKTKMQEFLVLDSDNDGMKDWEEALWKTDPQKTDTDGDGTSDSAEIKINRDPLKPNTAPKGTTPSDKVDEKIIAGDKKAVEEFNNLNETEKMSRMMFSQYLATKRPGESLSDAEMISIVQNALAELPNITLKQFAIIDLTLSGKGTPETIKEYGNNITKVMIDDLFGSGLVDKNYDFYGYAEITKIIEGMEGGASDSQLSTLYAELDPIIKKYQTLTTDLLKVPVPSDIANKHLALINTFEALLDNISKIKNSEKNIALLPSLLTFYSENIGNIWGAISDIGNVFIDNNITFSPSDLGNQLYGGKI